MDQCLVMGGIALGPDMRAEIKVDLPWNYGVKYIMTFLWSLFMTLRMSIKKTCPNC